MLTMLMPAPCRFASMNRALETMSDRVRRSRKEAQLTQQQLADMTGVTAAAVAQWETGDSKSLKPENLFKVARAVNKSPEWLATGEGQERPQHELLEDVQQRYNAMMEELKRDIKGPKRRNDHDPNRGSNG